MPKNSAFTIMEKIGSAGITYELRINGIMMHISAQSSLTNRAYLSGF